MKSCPICRCPAKEEYLPHDPDNVLVVACARCGSFKADEEFCRDWNASERTELEIANLSAWIRRRTGFAELRLADMEEYRTLRTPTVVEKADALIVALAKEFPIPGRRIDNAWEYVDSLHAQVSEKLGRSGGRAQFGATGPGERSWELLRYLSIAGVANPDELRWLIDTYLRKEELLTTNFQISPKGWQRIEQLRTGGIESRSGFVAMNFAPEFTVLFEQVLKPGIEAAGYHANRVDQKPSNQRIDDEIIAGIRECRFVVADASGHRPNVYYEAGYAKGLGRDVIWMVEEKDRATLHFDTRQYPYITWKRDALPEACKALEMRIAATIGRGPVRRNGESLRG